ncbi:hypothetical protein ACFX11_025996 [Malus domestica]
MSEAFYSGLEKGGADFYKIQHVPSLDFGPASEEFLSSLGKFERGKALTKPLSAESLKLSEPALLAAQIWLKLLKA